MTDRFVRGHTVGVETVVRPGSLRIYLGAAAGVGTTYAMIDEAIRRRRRGAVVVAGCVHTHGRPSTVQRLAELTDGVEGGATGADRLDVDALLLARPDVVLVDEIARRNPPDAAREQRWQDAEVLLAHGIDVIATMNVQQIDSLADAVRRVTGRVPDERVPDEFLSRTDQIEIVDISPVAIRRRLAHGNVFGPDDLRPFEADLFNTDAFAGLRALMMGWMADRLALGPDAAADTHEKVVAAVADDAGTDVVLRRAARLAHETRAALLGVHVVPPGSAADGRRDDRRARVERLGGSYQEISGADVARAVLSFAEAEQATQVVLGASAGRRRPHRPTIASQVLGRAGAADVHVVVTPPLRSRASRPRRAGPVSTRRLVAAAGFGAVLLATLTTVLVGARDDLSVATSLALYLLAVVAITAIGGPVPGLTAAVAAPLLANWYLIPPYHTFRVADGENLIELFAFVSVAAIVSWFVSVASRRALEAQRAQREASTLATLTGSGNLERPEVVVEQLSRAFRLDGVAVLTDDDRVPEVLAATGDAPVDLAHADIVAPLASGYVVAARGRPLSADDHRVLRAFLGQLSRAFEQQRLRDIAAEADALARADELRTAMLRAVSHDLRSPLSAIKASVSSLRQTDVEWPADLRDEFLESIEVETDRLTAIVSNLLDMSRLEAGVLHPVLRPVSLEEVVPGAVHGLGALAAQVVVDLPADLPEVQTDPVLLERVVANLVGNAVQWSPPGGCVRVRAHHPSSGTVQLHVIDQGPGIPTAQRAVVVQPFHRLGDSATGGGLGLGLAIADRLVAAMGGELELRDTPGGGLTCVVVLPAACQSAALDHVETDR